MFLDHLTVIKNSGKMAKSFFLAELQEFPIQPNPVVWADLARTSNSCSSERKEDFLNLVFGFGLICPEV